MTELITVVESPSFSREAERILSEWEKTEIISYLAAHPEEGDEIPGTGGLRKIRFASQQKGKRGGYRAIYFFYNESAPIFLLGVYSKSSQKDLTAEQKRVLTALTTELKRTLKKRRAGYGNPSNV